MSRLPKKLVGAILVTALVVVSFVDETAATSHDCSNGTVVPNASQNPGLVADCDALLSGKDTLDPDDVLDWDDQEPIGNWDGVTVTGTPQRVTRLVLNNSDLTGSIPTQLGDLSSLEWLHLYNIWHIGNHNSLTGSIPSELGDLSSLEQLALQRNALTGSIPSELGDLSNLEWLALNDNSLTGSIPSELGDLSNLETLALDQNSLTGSIPSELGDLSNLEALVLQINDLSGTIPTELGDLSSLRVLNISDNDLSGTIPTELGDLSNLVYLHLEYNDLSGTIPTELGDLSNLVWLRLENNDLSGTIPTELGDLSNLGWLALNDNSLTGSIPTELGDLYELQRLELYCNLLTGTIPSELGDPQLLQWLYVGGNRLTPPVPASIPLYTMVSTSDSNCGSAFNSAPTFTETDPTSRSIPENSTASSTVGTAVSATDSHSDPITYSISGTGAASFTIDSTSGQIRTSAALDFETDSSYSVTVDAADPYNGTSSIGVTISVTDVTEVPGQQAAPTLTSGYFELDVSWSPPANTGPAITDYDVQYRRSVDSSWSDHAFTGTTTSTQITGLEAPTEYEVQVRATNDEGTGDWSASATATTSDNRAPSFTDGATTTRSVAENTGTGQNIGGAIGASDADGDTLTYTMSGADAASFTIDSTSGQLKTSASVDYESDDSYSVTVEVSDGYEGTDSIAVTIAVTDVDEVPGQPSVPTLTSGYFELDVSWTAPANTGPAITDYDVQYRRTADSSWSDHAFIGTATSTHISDLERATEYEVQVRATNDEGTGDWSASATTTTNDNRAPSFTDGATTTRSVAENTGTGQNIGGAIGATDADGDTLTYTMSGADAASFTIDSTSGQLKTSASVDYETDDSYSVTVEVSDGYEGTDSIAVTISVTDVTEVPGKPSAPTVTPGYFELSVSWSAPSNTGPAITDYDVQYRRTADSSWSDHALTGTTTSTQITGLERSTEYEVQVRATNDEGTGEWSASATSTTSDNRAPWFTDGDTTTRSVAENTGTGQNIGGAVGATDADGDTLTYSISGTDSSSFTIDSTSGQLKTSSPLDYETDNSYSVTVEVSDGYEGTDSIAVTISVTDVPDVPGQPSAPTLTSGYFELNVNWSAPANPGPAITDYDVRNRRSADSSWSDHAFTGTTTSTQITGLERATEYEVQVRATNDEGTGAWSATATATTSDNRLPSFTDGATTTRWVAENTASSQNIGGAVGASDADGDTLTYSISGTDSSSFTIDSTSGQLKTSAPLDYESDNSYSVTVEVSDGYEGTDSISVTISVTDVTEVPGQPSVPTLTSGYFELDVSWSPPANTGPAITDYDVQYRRSADSSWSDHAFTGTTTSTQITGLERSTGYEVQVRATNDEGTGAWSTTTTATTNDNRLPSFTDGATTTRSVAENTASDQNIGGAVGAPDADGDTLTYSISGTDAASFTIDSTSGQLKTSASLDYETDDSYSVTVEVSDGHGGTDSIAVTIAVTDVDEVPGQPSVPTLTSGYFELDVSWSAPANTGPAITDYDVQYRRTADSSWSDHAFTGTTTSTQITSLAAPTEYEVQVRATNDEGTGDWSASAIATTSDNRAPSFIDGATTTRSVHENAATGWNIGGAIGATDADGDTLTYSISGTDAASFTIDSTSGQLKTSAPLDYETDDSYSVNVVASDGQGGTDSIAVTIRVTDINEPPGQPTALLVVPGWLPLTLDVSWTAPTNTGPAITGYDVWYKKVGNSSWSAHPFTGPTTFRQITGLQAASLYEVKVRATNAEGTGIWSGIETGLTGS